MLPSILAVLAIALGGERYVQLDRAFVAKRNLEIEKSNDEINKMNSCNLSQISQNIHPQKETEIKPLKPRIDARVTRIIVGDSCYYIGFLLTLWGLFLELHELGTSLRDSTRDLIADGLIGKLIAGNGLALLSTIIGLVSRFIIHRFFPDPPGDTDALDQLRTDFASYSSASLSYQARSAGKSVPAPTPPPVAGPQITIRTHAMSADVDASHGAVHISDQRDSDELRRRILQLEQQLANLKARLRGP